MEPNGRPNGTDGAEWIRMESNGTKWSRMEPNGRPNGMLIFYLIIIEEYL